MTQISHVPVLVEEIVSFLRPVSSGWYVDATLGLGGAAFRVLEKSTPEGKLIGIDQDPGALDLAKQHLASFSSRVRLVLGNFQDIKHIVNEQSMFNVNGIMFDLGVSSYQLGRSDRGFSFMEDGPLDMRMSPTTPITAADLVNNLPVAKLTDVLFQFGEERFSRRIAKSIVEARDRSPIRSTLDLVKIIAGAVPASYRHGRLHFATRTFQALRIAVNKELDILEQALSDAVELLLPGGRLGVISFHSLEDRIVKQTFRNLSKGTRPLVTTLTKKPVVASREEIWNNPRSRSAKLRVVERNFVVGEI